MNAILQELTNEFGKTVRIGQVKAKFPQYEQFVRENCVAIKMGTYMLEMEKNVGFVSDDEVAPNTIEPENVVMTETDQAFISEASGSVSYVPRKNSNYVPHGCYSVIRKVLASNEFCPVYVTGLSGNGKTLGIEQACAVEKRELIHINMTPEAGEDDLLGTFSLKDGNLVWQDGPVVTAMRRGAILLIDELDVADPSRVMSIQHVLQAGEVYIKKTNELVRATKGFNIIATGNTKGTGEGTDRFVGAQVLNEAFLERFNVMIEQDYPSEKTETKILSKLIDDGEVIGRLITFATATRKAYKDGGSDYCITTRRLSQIAKNFKIFKNELNAVTYAVSRFDSETRDSFILLYKQLIKNNTSATPEVDTSEEDDDGLPF